MLRLDYINGMGAIDYFSKTAAARSLGKASSREDMAKHFATMFYAELMKQVVESDDGIFSSDKESGYFANIAPLKNMFVDKMAEKLMASGWDAR